MDITTPQILVLHGGYEEAEISYKSAYNIYTTCRDLGYDPLLVDIRDRDLPQFLTTFSNPFVLNMVHGRYGEDGELHTLLEKLRIPFFGDSAKSLSITFDKILFREVNKSVPMPKARILDNRGYDRAQIEFPHVVKVHNSGSTIGVHYIDSTTAKTNLLSEWVEGIRIVEEFLDGPEGVIVIYKGEVIDGALVNYSGPLFDYNSKYDPQLSKLEPWDSLPATTREEVTQYGLDIYDNCQCSGFLSVEFRLKNGAPYILEANGIPGMTQTSLVPYIFARRGIGFKTLVQLMIAEYRQPIHNYRNWNHGIVFQPQLEKK